jgi:hypothetical protein
VDRVDKVGFFFKKRLIIAVLFCFVDIVGIDVSAIFDHMNPQTGFRDAEKQGFLEIFLFVQLEFYPFLFTDISRKRHVVADAVILEIVRADFDRGEGTVIFSVRRGDEKIFAFFQLFPVAAPHFEGKRRIDVQHAHLQQSLFRIPQIAIGGSIHISDTRIDVDKKHRFVDVFEGEVLKLEHPIDHLKRFERLRMGFYG